MEKKYALGVDLGGTTIKFGLFTSDGRLLEKWRIKTRKGNQGEFILADIAWEVNTKLKTKDIHKEEVVGLGIGIPGAVLENGYVAPCVNLDQWGGSEVIPILTQMCDLEVRITNDANAAALGEMWQGSARGSHNFVFITLGTGVGGCIVLDGKVVFGTHGAGGEIGHIKVRDDKTWTCGCGKKGCLEQYASATGLERQARTTLADTKEYSVLRAYTAPLTAEIIFDAARSGDSIALKLLDNFVVDLGKALAAVTCICDPGMIVIGGGISAAGDILLNAIKEKYIDFAFPSTERTEFRLAQLGNDAGIFGAAKLILN